jgi:hypothetical protein
VAVSIHPHEAGLPVLKATEIKERSGFRLIVFSLRLQQFSVKRRSTGELHKLGRGG